MHILDDMQACYGCSACFNACPQSAITMSANVEGFLQPEINQDACVECGACTACCPAREVHFPANDQPIAYAFVHGTRTVELSSSGGAFSALATQTIKAGGVVFGAVLDQSFTCRHVMAQTAKQLQPMLLSKYVQSDQATCYRQAEEALREGREVLYCGTPCQIAGLKNYLGKPYDNLCTVDLLCHGVPSPRDFHDYLDERWGMANIANVCMRRSGGWGSCMQVTLKDGERYYNISKNDLFLNAVKRDINLRSTCIQCKFSSVPRVGDITLGDFWTVKKFKLGDPYEKKSSLVLVNSQRGRQAWQRALDALASHAHCSQLPDNCVPMLNGNVSKPNATNLKGRVRYFQHRETMTFCQAAKETLFPFDVGLMLFGSDNYGSAATNVALYRTIESLGYRPVVLDNLFGINGVTQRYMKAHCNMASSVVGKGNYKMVNSLCDTYVLGSDQSLRWDFDRVRKNLEYVMFGFTDDAKRRIAYAASFGPERYELKDDERVLYAASLGRFQAMSVREDYAVRMCDRLFNVKAAHVLDPVFLLDKADYLAIAAEAAPAIPEDGYLLAYIRYASPQKKDLIQRASALYGLPIVIVCDASSYENLAKEMGRDLVVEKPSFEEWLAYYANATRVITDSFHGTCFSIILEKPFISIMGGTTKRFVSLANTLCDTKEAARAVFHSRDEVITDVDAAFCTDFVSMRANLDRQRAFSRSWLEQALGCDIGAARPVDQEVFVALARALERRDDLETYKKKREAQDVAARATSKAKKALRRVIRSPRARKLAKTAVTKARSIVRKPKGA